MSNLLQTVATYQASDLGILQNLYCGISTFNKKFLNFEKLIGNLGTTVDYDLPPRMIGQNSLVVTTFEGVEQRKRSITVNKERAVAFAFTAQELIFNIDKLDYRNKVGKSAMAALGSSVETDILSQILPSTYRFYGDCTSAGINSYTKLATALTYFRNYGSVPYSETKAYIPDIAYPTIVGSGLNLFIQKKNDETINSWDIGNFDQCKFYRSNLLPLHTAGTVGEDNLTLTVVSINGAKTQLTCSITHANDADALKENDLGYFVDNVSGETNMRYLTWTGYQVSSNPVQFRVTADAAISSNQIVFDIYPALIDDTTNPNCNINTPVSAGMQIKVMPSHRAGLICGDDAAFLAMPRLPDQAPFATSNTADEESGASIRLTTGSQFGGNSTGSIYDTIWGKDITPEYSMRLLFPPL